MYLKSENMRNFKYIIAVGLAVPMLSSCDMDLTPSTAISYEDGKRLFISENDITAFDNGLHSSFRSLFYGKNSQSEEVMFDAFNAVADFGNNYGPEHRCDQTFNASNSDIESIWQGHYSAIKNYNIAIANADNVSDELKSAARILKGNAYFYRAVSYLYLVRHFAKAYDPATASTELAVPLVTVYNQLEKPARATIEAVYAQIKTDLDAAYAILQNTKGSVRAQHPTVDAVNFVYARYYLDTKNYTLAAAKAESVINSSAGYALASSEEEMTDEYIYDRGTEPVMQMYVSKSEGCVYNTVYTTIRNDRNEGNYFTSKFIPSQVLIDSYGKGDLRFQTWFTDSKYPTQVSGTFHKGQFYTFVKYFDNPDLRDGTIESGAHACKPFMISEMYLIAAEAYAQNGNSNSRTMLNVLQTRRGASATDGSLANVKREWFRETVGEGLRMSCLKRWGDGVQARTAQLGAVSANVLMTGSTYAERALSASDYHFSWPIPTYDIKVNKNLVQNSGYADEK